jgi:signal transduction histidine kinase
VTRQPEGDITESSKAFHCERVANQSSNYLVNQSEPYTLLDAFVLPIDDVHGTTSRTEEAMTDAKTSSSLPVSPTTYSSSSTLRRTLSVYTTLLFCAVLSQICYYSRDGSAWRTSFFSNESDGAELTDSLKEQNFRNALLYSVIIAIPMVADLILDFALLGYRFQERLQWYSKATVLIALTTPNLLLLTVDFGEITNQAYVCGYWFFRIATVLTAMAFTATVAFKNKSVVSSGVLSVLQFGVMGYIVKGIGILCKPPLQDSLEKLSQFTRLLGLLTLLHCGLQKYIHRDSIFLTRMLEPTELTVLTYAVCLTVMHFSFIIVSAYTKGYSCDYITTCVYVQMAFVVTITVLQTKINRMEHVRQSKFNEERQAFIRYISHEIRTPLNTVFLGLELLTAELKKLQMSSDDVPVANLIEIVGDIQSPCQISLAILDDLLTMDKVEGGKMTLDLKQTDCCDFIATVVKPFCLNAKEKSIDLSTNFSLVSEQFILEACIHVDPSKMGQVIRNLISNAIKFTPAQGKVIVTVKHEVTASDKYSIEQAEVSSSRDKFAGGNHWLRIEVADSGAGISAQNQTKLFGQYVQFNANELQEGKGSGLGLWISKGIAELHGGIIGVFSEGEGKGSTFYLDLPVFFHKVGIQSENENEKKTECKNTTTEAQTRTSPTSRTSSSRTSSTSRSPVSGGSTDSSVVKFAAAPCKVEHASRHTVLGPTPNIPIPIPLAGFLPAIAPSSSGFLSCMSQTRYSADSKDSSAGFLSSVDHFMVTSTPASRSSERVTRSSGIVSLESYEDYFLETSGQGSPVSIKEASGESASHPHILHTSLLPTALPYTALHCLALPCLTLPYAALHCLALPYTALRCLTLPYTTLRCLTLPYTALHFLTLPYTA